MIGKKEVSTAQRTCGAMMRCVNPQLYVCDYCNSQWIPERQPVQPVQPVQPYQPAQPYRPAQPATTEQQVKDMGEEFLDDIYSAVKKLFKQRKAPQSWVCFFVGYSSKTMGFVCIEAAALGRVSAGCQPGVGLEGPGKMIGAGKTALLGYGRNAIGRIGQQPLGFFDPQLQNALLWGRIAVGDE